MNQKFKLTKWILKP